MGRSTETVLLAGTTRDVWPVAAVLATDLAPDMRIVVAEDDSPQPPAAFTVPLGSDYHRRLGLDLPGLVSGCGAVPSLGSLLEGFAGEGTELVTAPSGSLPAIGGLQLHQLLLRLRSEGSLMEDLAPFRFAARAARAGKFALPADGPQSPLAMLGPQVSVDRDRYAAMLRARYAARCDVRSGRAVAVSRSGDGEIESVTFEGSSPVAADFFVDCSGRMADLAGIDSERGQGVPDLFARTSVAAVETGTAPVLPRYVTDEHGLLCVTPVPGGEIREYRHRAEAPGDHLSLMLGEDYQSADGAALPAAAVWEHNCVRIGPAAGSATALLGADGALLQAGALHLADCFPARTSMQAEARAFTQRYEQTLAGVTDFANAPVALNTRSDALWRNARDAAISATLQTRIDQFEARGRVPSFERDHADEQTWIELLAGLGVQPRTHDRRAHSIPARQAEAILAQIRQQLDAALAAMPLRDAYMQALG